MLSTRKASFLVRYQNKRPSCRNRTYKIVTKESAKQGSDRLPKTEAATELSPEVQRVIEVASRIASMSDDQVRARYHELVDKRPALDALERFELERIEARLDAEDTDPALQRREREWQEQRRELMDSVEALLTRLRLVSH